MVAAYEWKTAVLGEDDIGHFVRILATQAADEYS